MPSSESRQYILGLDIGSASLGWALIDIPDGVPSGVIAAGVRVFDPGVDGNIDSGQDESRNKVRRDARLARRQFYRRARRCQNLFALLQGAGLLPPAPASFVGSKAASRDRLLAELDREIRSRWASEGIGGEPAGAPTARDHLLPYLLRARALDQPLRPFELGRALYHLSQRRGFKSNRKAPPKKDEEAGQVAEFTSRLAAQMKETGARTLAEYFLKLDPTQERIRGSGRWTQRAWLADEFDRIWSSQAPHHPRVLTEEFRKAVHKTIFSQRPLKWKRSTIGDCDLEPGRKRAPWACLAAQRFRILQKVNDIRILKDGADHRGITPEERAKVVVALEDGDQSLTSLRRLLALHKSEKLNLEEGGEKKLRGDRTGSLMRRCFGERWARLSAAERDRIIDEWRTIEDPESLKRRATRAWALEAAAAQLLADTHAEEGYCGLSRRALARLLPAMEAGTPFKTAERELYGARFSGGRVWESLPPVRSKHAVPELRNPAVERALTECRKVVNAVIRRFGKPSIVRVELARDLRNPRKVRKEISKRNRARQQEREEGETAILKEAGLPQPKASDVEKYLLWRECRGICPYTGARISVRDLFSEASQFEVEHILPLSRYPDNGFQNKTLCLAEENRQRKRNHTPFEAYAQDPERWGQILERVKAFNNPQKLERFRLAESDQEKLMADFSARQLSDTRYSSKIAQKYLGLLFGGRDVLEGEKNRRVIQATQGQVTATLRRAWNLESILGSGDGKGRDDHRHHAIDAIVTGLTEYGWVKQLGDLAARNLGQYGRASFRGLQAPWPEFVPSIRAVIEPMRVSHRPEHKLNGQLHQETNYGPAYELSHGRNTKRFVNVRKPLTGIKAGDLDDIVDPAVQEAVKTRLVELGGELKKLQLSAERSADGQPHDEPPALISRDGRRIPIRKVRLRQALEITSVGADERLRNVKLGSNHHVEILALLDDLGAEKEWEGVVVSRLEAMTRKRKGLPVIQRDHGIGRKFKFSLMGGDLVELDVHGQRSLYVVRTIAESGQFALARATDARRLTEMKQEKKETKDASVFLQPMVKTLRAMNCRKVSVDPLGYLRVPRD